MRNPSLLRLVTGMLFSLTFCSTGLAQAPKESAVDLIVVISGFASDPSPPQLANESPRGRGNSGMYQLAGDLTKAGFQTQFFNWNGACAGQINQKDTPGADAIVAFVRNQNASKQLKHLVLIGHSWGGHTLMDVAEKLNEDQQIKILLAIGVDPSSLSRGERVKTLPSNIQSFVNYHTHNAFVWGSWQNEDRVENVDLGDAKGRFAANHRRNYAATFDIDAHNAAEWDELIHSDIIQRVQKKTGRSKLGVLSDPGKRDGDE